MSAITPMPGVFSQEDAKLEDAAAKLKVLGHPLRLKVLMLIARGEEPCVSELWVCLRQPQPVISQHLAVLKEKGIVRSVVRGNRRTYAIVDPFIQELVLALEPGCAIDVQQVDFAQTH